MSATFENDVVGWLPDAPQNHTQISPNSGQHSAQIFDASTPIHTLRLLFQSSIILHFKLFY